MNLLLAVYFAVGLARDALAVAYYISISRNRAFSAAAWSGAITLFDIFVLATLLIKWNIGLAISYGVGCAVGTYFVVRAKR
jgi:hypothetical protein